MKYFLSLSWVFTFAIIGYFLVMSQAPLREMSQSSQEFDPHFRSIYDFKSSPRDLSFAELETLLATGNYKTVEDVLAYLKINKPQYMSHYVLVSNTGSIQGASKENPRAIVYGERGHFVMTFNDGGLENSDSLETMQFNEEKKEFEFRSISFSEQEIRGKFYSISEVGGHDFGGGERQCLQCHTGGRPRWEGYFLWPGVYGGLDDSPFNGAYGRGGVERKGSRVKITEVLGISPQKIADEWAWFENDRLSQGRYKYLNPLPVQVLHTEEEYYHPSPNLSLTTLLFRLNGVRIARKIKNAHLSPQKNLALLYSFDCMGSGLRRLPPRVAFNGKIDQIMNADKETSDRDIMLLQVSRLDRLLKDFSISPRDLQDSFSKYCQSHPEQECPKKSLSQAQILTWITKNGIDGIRNKNQNNAHFIALAKKLVPSPWNQNWSTAADGTADYFIGLKSGDGFYAGALIQELFDESMARSLKDLRAKDSRSYCQYLEENLPEDLKWKFESPEQ